MKKVLTIIIPTYNVEKYLDKCLNSLIVSSENRNKIEVLIIIDGSKDRSSEIGHKYQNLYPEIFRVIDKENGNYGSCINRGLKEAKGEYVKVLDADDYFDTAVFDDFVVFLEQNDTDLVISDFTVVDENYQKTNTYTYQLPTNRVFSLKEMSEGVIEWLWHHAVTYRTDILRKIDYKQTEGISYTDDEWIYEPMAVVKKVAYYPRMLYQYLRGREGQTFDPNVMERCFTQRVTVARNLVKAYSRMNNVCTEDSRYYLTTKLAYRLYPIYSYYLFQKDDKKGMDSLKELDEDVKVLAPDVLKIIRSHRNRMGFRYIKAWQDINYWNNMILMCNRIIFHVIDSVFPNKVNNLSMPEAFKRKEL